MYEIIEKDVELSVKDIEEMYEMEVERQREESWAFERCERASVEAAIASGTRLRVRHFKGVFEVVLLLNDAEKSQMRLYSRLDKGGLFTEDCTAIFRPYEFSMQKYQHNIDTRAATEYVRRKLSKLRV
jgi:hypothetical protein